MSTYSDPICLEDEEDENLNGKTVLIEDTSGYRHTVSTHLLTNESQALRRKVESVRHNWLTGRPDPATPKNFDLGDQSLRALVEYLNHPGPYRAESLQHVHPPYGKIFFPLLGFARPYDCQQMYDDLYNHTQAKVHIFADDVIDLLNWASHCNDAKMVELALSRIGMWDISAKYLRACLEQLKPEWKAPFVYSILADRHTPGSAFGDCKTMGIKQNGEAMAQSWRVEFGKGRR